MCYAFQEIAPKNEYEDRYYIAVIFVGIRCIMFFDDAIRLNATQPLLGKQNLCTFLHFIFYPPTLLFGPIVTYRSFIRSVSEAVFSVRETSMQSPQSLRPLQVFQPVRISAPSLGRRAVRLLFAAVLLHVSLYIFYPSFLRNPKRVQPEDWLAFIGCLYLKGLGFYLVYLQKYGLSWILATYDGFQMPEWPVCISHVFSYVEMWR